MRATLIINIQYITNDMDAMSVLHQDAMRARCILKKGQCLIFHLVDPNVEERIVA